MGSALRSCCCVFQRGGWQVDYFIPDRIRDGYGLSLPAFKTRCAKEPPQLVVTVDCGTNSRDAVSYATSLGVDVIVTDHHEPATEYAEAYAVLNPKLGQEEALQTLCGAGVVFKLLHGLVKSAKEKILSRYRRRICVAIWIYSPWQPLLTWYH